jgi:hypothetical protein
MGSGPLCAQTELSSSTKRTRPHIISSVPQSFK